MSKMKLGLKGRYTLIIFISIIGLIVMYSHLPKYSQLDPKTHTFVNEFKLHDEVPENNLQVDLQNRESVDIMRSNNNVSRSSDAIESRAYPRLQNMDDIIKRITRHLKSIAQSDINLNAIKRKVFKISEFMRDNRYVSDTSCKDMDEMILYENLNRNNMDKLVNRALYDDTMYILLKSPGIDIRARAKCFKLDSQNNDCDNLISYNVLREILNHLIFTHDAIAPMMGFCMRGAGYDAYDLPKRGVVMVMENGNNYVSFSRRPWRTRAAALLSLARLLTYLERSPLGSVVLHKVTLDDFADFDGSIKFVDLDEIRVGEKKCHEDSECLLHGMSVDVSCDHGECRGLNAKTNIQSFCDTIFYALLEKPPIQVTAKKRTILQLCNSLKVTPDDLVDKFIDLEATEFTEEERQPKPARPRFPWQQRSTSTNGRDDIIRDRNVREFGHSDNGNGNRDNRESNTGLLLENLSFQSIGHYRIYTSTNMPSMHDYQCVLSRVQWGCLLEAKDKFEAMNKCDDDVQCKAVTVFSSDQSHSTAPVAIILKNGTSPSVVYQEGVTLLVHSLRSGQSDTVSTNNADGNIYNKNTDFKLDDNNNNQVGGINASQLLPDKTDQCLRYNYMKYPIWWRQRETTLMTQLAHTGLTEKDWLASIHNAHFSKFEPLLEHTFSANVDSDRPTQPRINVSTVISHSNGGHIAQLLTYYVDRMLGLSHVPPSTYHSFATSDLATVLTADWFRQFRGNIRNSQLPVVLTIPKPPVFTIQQLSIPLLPHIQQTLGHITYTRRTEVGGFDNTQATRLHDSTTIHTPLATYPANSGAYNLHTTNDAQKSMVLTIPKPPVFAIQQLSVPLLPHIQQTLGPITYIRRTEVEYALILALMGIVSSNGHVAIKDQLVHFMGDQAFQTDDSEWMFGYLNNCQFPEVTYYALFCYKCHTASGCSLGNEVINSLIKEGVPYDDIKVNNMSADEISTRLNNYAHKLTTLIGKCVTKYGVALTLY